MKTIASQKGVGLIEVLVALLILAIGVLGFVAMQIRAMQATVEGGARIQAINIARDLAERMRVNRDGQADYITQLSDPNNQKNLGASANCADTYCDAENLADYDVAEVVEYASALGMTMNIISCPGTSNGRQCIYVAWDDTSATNSTDPDATSCTYGTAYRVNSTCVIMEAY